MVDDEARFGMTIDDCSARIQIAPAQDVIDAALIVLI
jgi:hypothetical protein